MFATLFPRNESSLDRAVRIGLGAGLISLAFVGPETAWGWIGLIPLATGLVGSCPAYTLLGIGTSHPPATRKAA
jgi:hypothetical protein